MVRGVLGLKDLKGLVLETFGAGNAPEDDELIGVLEEGVKMGVVIVNVTQCQVGTVSPLYASATALAKAGVVFGLDMTSEGEFPLCRSLPLPWQKRNIILFRRLFFFSSTLPFPLIAPGVIYVLVLSSRAYRYLCCFLLFGYGFPVYRIA